MEEIVIRGHGDGTAEESQSIPRRPDGQPYEWVRRERPTQHDFTTDWWERDDGTAFQYRGNHGKVGGPASLENAYELS